MTYSQEVPGGVRVTKTESRAVGAGDRGLGDGGREGSPSFMGTEFRLGSCEDAAGPQTLELEGLGLSPRSRLECAVTLPE